MLTICDLKSYFSNSAWRDDIINCYSLKNYGTEIIFIHVYLILANFLFEFSTHTTESYNSFLKTKGTLLPEH